jgi:hypothetical protein
LELGRDLGVRVRSFLSIQDGGELLVGMCAGMFRTDKIQRAQNEKKYKRQDETGMRAKSALAVWLYEQWWLTS